MGGRRRAPETACAGDGRGRWLGRRSRSRRRRLRRPSRRPAGGERGAAAAAAGTGAGGGAGGRSGRRGGALRDARGRRGDPGGARPACPRATSRRRRRRSTRWWRGIRRSGRSMPTAPGSRCCRASRRRRWRCSRQAAAHGFAGFPRLARRPALRRRSPATRGSRRSSPRPGGRCPAPVADGVAPVDAGNTAWNPETERLRAALRLPGASPRPGVLPPGKGPAARDILAELWQARPRRRQPRRPLRQPRPRPFDARPERAPAARLRRLCRRPPAPPTSTTG